MCVCMCGMRGEGGREEREGGEGGREGREERERGEGGREGKRDGRFDACELTV